MNKRIDFSFTGGFPATQDTLDKMQHSYRDAFAGLAGLIGDKVIVSGVVVTGGTVSGGWISVGGELMPFIGGSTGASVIVEEVADGSDQTFEDGGVHTVYYKKQARIGTPASFPFTDLVRPNTIKETWQTGDVKQLYVDAAYIAANFDGTGLGINLRTGWKLMNGNNGTINMGGRVAVGYDPGDTDYDNAGDIGGSKTATLIKANIPVLNVDRPLKINDTDRGGSASNFSLDNVETVNVGGSATPFDIRQPYATLVYIVKI